MSKRKKITVPTEKGVYDIDPTMVKATRTEEKEDKVVRLVFFITGSTVVVTQWFDLKKPKEKKEYNSLYSTIWD